MGYVNLKEKEQHKSLPIGQYYRLLAFPLPFFSTFFPTWQLSKLNLHWLSLSFVFGLQCLPLCLFLFSFMSPVGTPPFPSTPLSPGRPLLFLRGLHRFIILFSGLCSPFKHLPHAIRGNFEVLHNTLLIKLLFVEGSKRR